MLSSMSAWPSPHTMLPISWLCTSNGFSGLPPAKAPTMRSTFKCLVSTSISHLDELRSEDCATVLAMAHGSPGDRFLVDRLLKPPKGIDHRLCCRQTGRRWRSIHDFKIMAVLFVQAENAHPSRPF